MKLPYRLLMLCCAAHTARAGLVGYWNFDEGAGTTAYDYTVNNNEGTLASIGGSVPAWIAGHSGNAGDNALQFAQGNVTVPDSASLHITNRFTLAAWYWDNGSNYGHLFVAGDGGVRNWLLQTSNYGGDAAYFWSTSNGSFQRSLGFVPTLNAWHHIAVTYDGSALRSYLDGTLKSTANFASSLSAWGTLRLGGFNVNGSGFEGRLDDMVIFNTVENVASIKDGTHPAMLGHWTGGGTGPLLGWSDAANWGGTLPKFSRPLIFDTGNGLTTNTNDFPAGQSFKGIRFLSGAGAFTLSGNSITLTGDVLNSSTGTQTIALTGGVALGSSSNCAFAAAAGELAVTGGVRGSAGKTCGVTKSGAFKVTLAGDMTYSGDTAVTEGRLALGSPNPSNDTTTVSIAGGGKLELNFSTGATDRVRALLIGGASMPDGVYGSTASGAAHPDDTHFAGEGTLTVSAGQRVPKTFYVSQSSGDDAWTGETDVPGAGDGPWKTLAKASSASLVPGDRILLKCGDTWNEELQPKGNGTAANPIRIGSYGSGNKPVINRGDVAQQNGIHLIDQEGYKIVGIEFSHCETGIWAEYHAGQPARDYLWIEDCYFHDSLRYGAYYDYYNAKNISVGISLWTFVSWSSSISLQNVTVTNCTFRRMASAFWTNSPDNFDYNADNFYNFANVNILGCLFEEGYQWQLGFRGILGGEVANCVTHDIGRLNNFVAFNGVAGGMFYRVKNYRVTDSEWGFVSRGGGSGDGEAFDLEGNNDNITFTRCLFHDADGPCFMLFQGAAHGNYGMVFTNCLWNGKSPNSSLGREEIFNASPGAATALFSSSRFYLSPGESVCNNNTGMTYSNCLIKNLADAASSSNSALAATASASSQQAGSEAVKACDGSTSTLWRPASASNEWLQIEFASPTIVNEFRIREDASSAIIRYTIQCWDPASSNWVGCFNGRAIGANFIAPAVSRTTTKVRLLVVATSGAAPGISEFEAYNGVPSTITWAAGNGAWDLSGAPNWKDAGGSVAGYVDGCAVVLDDSASGASPVTVALGNAVAPYGVTANNSAKNYILNGAGSIGGAAILIKNGSGVLTIATTNTYSGSTTVNAGTLRAGAASVTNGGPFGLNSPVTMANVAGAVLDLAGFDTQIGSLAGGGGAGGNVALGTNVLTVGVNNGSSGYAGVLSSSGAPAVSLKKVGAGTFTLQRANTYTGRTVVEGGTLYADESNGTLADAKPGAVPASFQADNIIIRNGAALLLASGTDGRSLSATRGIYLEAGMQTINTGSGDFYLNGVISGPGGLLHGNTGAGGYRRLYLTAANTFTGDTRFDGTGSAAAYGGIEMSNPLALQYSAFDTSSVGSKLGNPAALILGGLVGSVNLGGVLNNTALTSLTLQPQLAGVTKTYSGVISGAAGMTLTKSGAGTQVLAGNNTYSGGTRISGGVLQVGGGGAGGSLGTGPVTNNATLVFSRSDAAYTNAAPISGTGSVAVAGSGTITFSGTNTYSGATIVSNGVLRLTHSQCLSTNADLFIAPAAKCNLAYAGTNEIRDLYLDGVAQARGTYGAAGSGAAHESSFFTGAGMVNVTGSAALPPAPVLSGTAISIAGEGAGFRFETVSGVKYRLMYRNELTDPAWLPVINPPDCPPPEGWSTTSAGSPMTLTDTNMAGQGHRYYQLRAAYP